MLHHENIAVTEHGYYVEAKDLKVGDVFLGANDELTTLTETHRKDFPEGITVYNFSVEDDHNYFVIANYEAFQNGAQPVLVHNANANGGVCGGGNVHGGAKHNSEIDQHISKLKLSKNNRVTNIRKHQRQVDINGNEIGRNLPDIQFDFRQPNETIVHFNVEFDNALQNSIRHNNTIRSNDPSSKVITRMVR
jgi:hypothetical protein